MIRRTLAASIVTFFATAVTAFADSPIQAQYGGGARAFPKTPSNDNPLSLFLIALTTISAAVLLLTVAARRFHRVRRFGAGATR